MRKTWAAAGLVALLAVFAIWLRSRGDDWPPHDGKLRQTVQVTAHDLRRGAPGTVGLRATAHLACCEMPARNDDRSTGPPVSA